ncbi:MAG: TrkA C-terminal domain-containing protein, partial [Candidatus Acidiferrales bacterium]
SQLLTGALRPESPWVGKQIQARALSGPAAAAKIVAVLRGKSVMLGRADTVLQPGDRLLLIAPAGSQEQLSQHIATPSTPDQQAVPTAAS